MKKFWLALFLLTTILTARAYEALPSQQLCNEKTTWIKMESRRNWSQYADWSTQNIRALLDDAPASDAIKHQFLQVPDPIGNWFEDFYGFEAGKELQNLLRTHIQSGSEMFSALESDDKEAFQNAMTAWYENADQLATFLHDLNPFWEADTMRKMLNTLLELLEKQAAAHHAQNWDKEIDYSKRVTLHVQDFADQLAVGVINQFPEHFK